MGTCADTGSLGGCVDRHEDDVSLADSSIDIRREEQVPDQQGFSRCRAAKGERRECTYLPRTLSTISCSPGS